MGMKQTLNRNKTLWVIILSIIIYHLSFSRVAAQVGTWKAYMSYHDVQQIQKAGDDLFVLASNDLYQYNLNDNSITTYDKTNGLSDTYIDQIKWCQRAKRLIATYKNSNIDLVETDGTIINVSDLYTKAITGDKTINAMTIKDEFAYFACGFGIMKMNVSKAEIVESYMLNENIVAIVLDDTHIYAKKKNGQVLTALLSNNLIDPNNWSQTTTFPSFDTDTSDYDTYIEQVKTLNPGGPKYNYTKFLRFKNGKLYSCDGIMKGKFDPNLPGTIQVWDGNEWEIYEDNLKEKTGHSYMDIASIDVDPTDPTHLYAGGRVGLYEFKDGKFVKEYNYDNSDLKTTAAIGTPTKDYTMVETVLFDKSGSLWLFNSGSDTGSLYEITKDGKWVSHHKEAFFNTAKRAYDNVVNAMFDSRGLLWLCNDRFIQPALLCYQPSTDAAIAYTKFVNQDGTTLENSYDVSCVAEDKDNNIWFGTDKGPFVIMSEDIGKSAEDMVFTQVKVPRNDGTDYADYLLDGIDVTCIKVDNDGNKWIGTNGMGVYVISYDNMTEMHHFTTENSPIISDIVGSIDIDEDTGEVFFGTDMGLCSYKSGITHVIEEMNEDEVHAYPNPVTPDYTGYITITGLTHNADVKILSSGGRLVTEGRSSGRFFKWDGCDKNGNRVASGVYMVATATSDGKKGVVCKIAVIK